MTSVRAARGFTLVEVLVALVVTAIALLAGLKATAALTENAERQDRILLAQLCADNRLIELRLTRQFPGPGASSSNCSQGPLFLQVQQNVQPTPNPNFRRVDVTVQDGALPLLHLSTIVGRN